MKARIIYWLASFLRLYALFRVGKGVWYGDWADAVRCLVALGLACLVMYLVREEVVWS